MVFAMLPRIHAEAHTHTRTHTYTYTYTDTYIDTDTEMVDVAPPPPLPLPAPAPAPAPAEHPFKDATYALFAWSKYSVPSASTPYLRPCGTPCAKAASPRRAAPDPSGSHLTCA